MSTAAEPIMIVKVKILKEQISELRFGKRDVKILPFEGTVRSSLFSGRILPGASDVQTVDASGTRHMCAKYMFEGKDSEGNDCRLYVENNGYFPKDFQKSPFDACPTILTDSPVLAPYFMADHFRTEGHPAEGGVEIWFFDTEKEDF